MHIRKIFFFKKDNFIAKKDLRPKGADNTNNTQDNHQTDIFNTYHIYTVNNTTLYTLQQQGQRKPQIQLQIIPFYTYFI